MMIKSLLLSLVLCLGAGCASIFGGTEVSTFTKVESVLQVGVIYVDIFLLDRIKADIQLTPEEAAKIRLEWSTKYARLGKGLTVIRANLILAGMSAEALEVYDTLFDAVDELNDAAVAMFDKYVEFGNDEDILTFYIQDVKAAIRNIVDILTNLKASLDAIDLPPDEDTN